jgi:RecJ-like exonuclease
MKEGITVNEHKSVGPCVDIFGHGPVIVIQRHENKHIDEQLWSCLDCGYTVKDNRAFLHEECNRERNPVNQTFREYLEENEYPDGD